NSDFLVRLIGAPFILVAGLSAYAIARELRAPRATAVLAAVAFAAIPAVARTAYLGAKPDPVMLATFGTGVLFALRHLRIGRTSDLVLGGLSLGICFGTKWYAVPDVAIVVAVWGGAALVQRRGRDFVLRGGAILAGLIALAGGFWFLRNGVGTGNPLYPLATPGFGDAPTDFYRECVGYSIAYYLTDTDVLRNSIWPGLQAGLGFGGVVLFAGWLGASGLAIKDAARRGAPVEATDARSAGKAARRRQRRAGAAVATVAVMSGILGLGYVLTPYTALGLDGVPTAVAGQARYATPALLLAAPLLAWVAGRLGKLRVGVELLTLLAVMDGVGRAFDVTAANLVVAVVGLAAATGAGYAIYVARHHRRILVPVAAATALAAFGIADFRQHEFDDGRYETDAVIAYLSDTAPGNARIALAGGPPSAEVAPAWPAFGKRLDRTVEYLGHEVNGQLREYDDENAWRRAIEDGKYDLIVVGRGGYAPECRLPGAETDDDAWARNAGFRVVARTDRQTVYAVGRSD
ncbi:MAG: glycosyltransferase family 39 protein, partial [Thermoleophilaceae bacterium]